MKLQERIKEIESERERMREMLANRIEAAVNDYEEETGEKVNVIEMRSNKAKVGYFPAGHSGL